MTSSSKLQILCGECGEESSFETTSPVVCQKCQKPLSDKGSYSRFGPRMALMLVGASVGGTVAFNAITDVNRYPIFSEYSIIDMCINGSEESLSSQSYLTKSVVCACALKGAQEDFDEESWMKEMQQFTQSFKSHTRICLKGKKIDGFN